MIVADYIECLWILQNTYKMALEGQHKISVYSGRACDDR